MLSYRSRNISEATEEPINMSTEQGLPVQDETIGLIPGVSQDSSDLGYSLVTGSNAFVDLQQVNFRHEFCENLSLPTHQPAATRRG